MKHRFILSVGIYDRCRRPQRIFTKVYDLFKQDTHVHVILTYTSRYAQDAKSSAEVAEVVASDLLTLADVTLYERQCVKVEEC